MHRFFAASKNLLSKWKSGPEVLQRVEEFYNLGARKRSRKNILTARKLEKTSLWRYISKYISTVQTNKQTCSRYSSYFIICAGDEMFENVFADITDADDLYEALMQDAERNQQSQETVGGGFEAAMRAAETSKAKKAGEKRKSTEEIPERRMKQREDPPGKGKSKSTGGSGKKATEKATANVSDGTEMPRKLLHDAIASGPRGRGGGLISTTASASAAIVLDDDSDNSERDTMPLTRRLPSIRTARVETAEPVETRATENRGEFDPTTDSYVDANAVSEVARSEAMASGSRTELATAGNQEVEDTAQGGENIQPRLRLNVTGSEMEEISIWIPKSLTVSSAPVLPPVGIRKMVFPEDAKKLDAMPLPSQFNYSVAHCFTALQGVLRSGENAIGSLSKERTEKERLEGMVKGLEDNLANVTSAQKDSEHQLIGEKNKNTQMSAQISRLEEKLKEADEQLLQSTESLSALEKKIHDDAYKATQFESRIDQAIRDAQYFKDCWEGVTKQLESAEAKVNTLEFQVHHLADQLGDVSREKDLLNKALAAQTMKTAEKVEMAKKMEENYLIKIGAMGGVGQAAERFRLLTQYKKNEHPKWDVDLMLKKAVVVLENYQPNKRWVVNEEAIGEPNIEKDLAPPESDIPTVEQLPIEARESPIPGTVTEDAPSEVPPTPRIETSTSEPENADEDIPRANPPITSEAIEIEATTETI
ncbi:uncharacterized protein LOC120014301 isoform X1 [Tripterygium wilfordii]|uniref:uncharacterized protein LOC120014301 isoform X1 n=1 Tax=Tripterygium wilfordii TaxID=458696 RepID=UPI0018F85DAA|nr:uncharacterized protein LOC120014301 isoform X1 [Tripterygium wilfordii]